MVIANMHEIYKILFFPLLVGHLAFSMANAFSWLGFVYVYPKSLHDNSVFFGFLKRFIRNFVFPDIVLLGYVLFGVLLCYFAFGVGTNYNLLLAWSIGVGVVLAIVSCFSESNSFLGIMLFFVPILFLFMLKTK